MNDSISKTFKLLRDVSLMSAMELSDKSFVSVSTISYLETGRKGTGSEKAARVIDALGVSTEEFDAIASATKNKEFEKELKRRLRSITIETAQEYNKE